MNAKTRKALNDYITRLNNVAILLAQETFIRGSSHPAVVDMGKARLELAAAINEEADATPASPAPPK